jgi:probable F420-dependent oxidoreductase
MQFGFGLPSSMNSDDICRFARKAEELGFESVWAADHIVLPTAGTNQYPYTADGSFSRPSDAPFLEPFTVLGFVAGCTRTIRIGSTVVILPYRHPIMQAKMFATLDVLSKGRLTCGVGVGWLEKEFQVLDKPYADRGAMTTEYLAILKNLWTQTDPVFEGQFHQYEGIKFEPKPLQKPHPPIWVGGHSRPALRRAAQFGDAWHPTRQTPEYVAEHLPYLWEQAKAFGRDPEDITISLKRTLHFTDIDVGESGNVMSKAAMIGTTREVIDDVRHCQELGIQQLTYDFRVSKPEECDRVLEHFAEEVVPAVQ